MSSDDERGSGDATDPATLIKANEELRREILYRSRVEEALRADVERFRMMIGAVTDYAILMLDTAGYIVSWNDGAGRITGYDAAEIIGQHFSRFYRAAAAGGKAAAVLQAAGADGRHAGEGWWVRKDGANFWANTILTSIFDSHEVLRGFSLVAQDITERKRTESTLQMQARVIERMTESVIVADEAGLIVTVNPATERMFGYAKADLVGRHVGALYGEQGPQVREEIVERLSSVHGGTTWSGEIERRKKDGSPIMTRTQISAFELDGRRHYYSINEDITERKRAEEELRWKTAFLEAQVNSSGDGILVVDERGEKTLQNHRMNEMWNIPQAVASDPDDHNQSQWVTAQVKCPAEFAARVAHLYSHPNEVSKEEIELKNGTVLDRYSAPVLGGDGKYYGRIWSFREITERKQLEAHLLQSQKLEIVGRLAGGVAHEFNSILTVILGQGEFLLGELPEDSPLRADAREIVRATERAADLTRQLLAYGRQQYLQPEPLDLNQIIHGLEPTFRLIMGGSIEVKLIPATELWTVKADAGQMEQVIMNLAVNAHQAMPNGGQLILETGNVTLDAAAGNFAVEAKPGHYVRLTVSDTGVGMTDEVKARAFEPFFSTKDVGQGSGLGLATCYGIVKQSGGNITVQSAPGQGTTFKILLPKAEPVS